MVEIAKKPNLMIIGIFVIFTISTGVFLFNIKQPVFTHNYIEDDFDDDKLGSIPSEFTGTGRRFGEVQVVQWNETDNHGNVVEIGYFEERTDPKGTELSILFEKSVKGIVEFDVYNKVGGQLYLDLVQEDVIYDFRDDICIRMPRTNRDHITAMDGLGIHKNILYFTEKTWYSFRIKFNVKIGWDLIIIGLGSNTFNHFQFYHQPKYFSQLYFATYILDNVFYIDNIRISLLEQY